jgi:hypothetical protein
MAESEIGAKPAMMHPMKISSDGTPRGTTILDSAGNTVPCSRLCISMTPDGGRVELELLSFTLEIEGEAEIKIPHPLTRQLKAIKKITFEDGSEWPGES